MMKNNMLNEIYNILWPHLESKNNSMQLKDISGKEISDNADLSSLLEISKASYDDETNRMHQIESKTTIFIGLVSVLASVVIGFISGKFDYLNFNLNLQSIILILFVVYMMMTLFNTIRSLRKIQFFKLDPTEYLNLDKEKVLKQEIADYIMASRRNNISINTKVDYMTLAQDFFLRALITFCSLPIVMLLDKVLNL